jgi:ATP-dependent Clp protease adaptor protein ClpS
MSMKKQGNPNQQLVLMIAKAECRPPKLYRVFLINDDYTPMDFVIEVLERFFSMDSGMASQVMLEVHRKGRGNCGLYSYDIAETKVVQVTEYAKTNQYPLLCDMEKN